MLVLVGLGNPETKYSLNRHNVGFMIIDSIAKKYSFSPFKNKFQSHIITSQLNGKPVILVKPQTFMNLSGQSVSHIKKFYKLQNKQIIVIHDDLDLNIGKIKTKIGGGSGGHNGIKSINYIINATDYFRLRIGVGRPPSGIDPAEYVLSRFLSDEIEEIKFLVEDAIDIVKVFPKDKEMAIKQASERRIIDVV